MYFLSNIWRGVKLVAAGLGIIASGGVIIYGAVTGGTIYVIGGIICLIPSGLLVFDSSKVLQDIKNAITKFNGDLDTFKKENSRLANEMDEFDQENKVLAENVDNFVQENNELSELLTQTKEQIESMEKLQSDIEAENKNLQKLGKDYKKENEFYETQNEELKQSVLRLSEMQSRFKDENETLNNLVTEANEKINELTEIEQTYKSENVKLAKQIEHLGKLYNSAKELAQDLMKATDLFSEYQSSFETDLQNLDKTSDNLEHNVDVLSNLMTKLKEEVLLQKFDEIDLDGDEKITKKELEMHIGSK